MRTNEFIALRAFGVKILENIKIVGAALREPCDICIALLHELLKFQLLECIQSKKTYKLKRR